LKHESQLPQTDSAKLRIIWKFCYLRNDRLLRHYSCDADGQLL